MVGDAGILDTVRGMIICSSMPEASAVLHALEQESSRGGASGRPYLRLVRSKNRFRNPSSGGWMDCLINVRLVRNGDRLRSQCAMFCIGGSRSPMMRFTCSPKYLCANARSGTFHRKASSVNYKSFISNC